MTSVPVATAVTLLPGSLHPAARPERDLGRMDPTVTLMNLSLLLDRSAAQKKQLAKDLVAIQDPTSPSYHQWLSPSEFGARYGAAPSDIARAKAWLDAQGFHVLEVSPSATRLSFSGTIGQVEQAFRTEMHRYQVRGAQHFALSRAPSIPADLGTVVSGLHGAHDFRPAPPRPPGSRQPMAKFSGSYALAPADFAAIYNVNGLYNLTPKVTGSGQTIAVVGESYYNPGDVLSFRQTFGFDTTNVPTDMLVPNTGSSEVLDPSDVSESELDMEWSGSIAPDATILFVYTGDSPNSYGFFDSMVYAIEQRLAPIVTVSYGACEKGLTPSDAVYYEQAGDLAAMVGVTVLVASGDTGAAGCDGQQESAGTQGLFIGFPASIPSITAVGGTQLTFTLANESTYWNAASAATGYIPEAAWNQTFVAHAQGLGASGGGYSVMFARPYWQAGALPSSSFRGVPDVAFSASSYDVPYLIYESWTAADGPGETPFAGTLNAIGGTSASTPSFAGIVALLNQAIHAPVSGLGNMNPQLYALAASAASPFHDVTTGSNMVPCESGTTDCTGTEYGYNAGVGYDLVTGLGSVDALQLVNAWTSLAPTSTALAVQGSGAAEGTNLQLTATVGSNATANSLTGTVTFYFKTVDLSGQPDIGYVLGEAPVVADTADGGAEGATATLMAPAPVGLTGASQIVAFYGGDQSYLASYSAATSVMATTTFAVTPPSLTLQPNQQTTFTATGGVPPVSWRILSDTTCNPSQQNCAETLSSSPTTDGFQAGPSTGSVILEALDSDYAEVRVTITVSGAPVDGGALIPVDAGMKVDAGHPLMQVDAGVDAAEPEEDAGTDSGALDSGASVADAPNEDDAGTRNARDASKSDGGDAQGSSGGCSVAARGDGPDVGFLGALFLGFAPLVTRRRRAGLRRR